MSIHITAVDRELSKYVTDTPSVFILALESKSLIDNVLAHAKSYEDLTIYKFEIVLRSRNICVTFI